MSTYSLTSPEVLYGSGMVSDPERITYDFANCSSAARQALVPALPLSKSSKVLESWWDLAPRYAGQPDDWRQVLKDQGTPVPLYLRHPELNYWFDSAAPGGAFYVQYNRSADAKDETLAAFAARVSSAIASEQPRAVIVDLRFNTGGNSAITPALVSAVNRAASTTPVYVIVGRATFSAGIVAAAQLRTARRVTIVGEPVGDALDFWSEGGNIILPYSGLYFHFANGAHSLSPKSCPTPEYCVDLNVPDLKVDIPAPPDWISYRQGIDPALLAIEHDLSSALRPLSPH